MTYGQDERQPYGEPWQPQPYDPAAHQHRVQGQPQKPTWQQSYPPQDYGQQYPPQYQLWQQPGTWEQPGYGQQPQYQPPRSHRRKSWLVRHKVLTGLIAFAGVIIFASIASALSKPGAGKPAANTTVTTRPASLAAAPSSASAAPPDCTMQAKTWVNGSNITAFGTDVGTFASALQTLAGDMVGTTAPASDTAAVQSAAATIQADAQATEADPGPSCIPGLRADLTAGARDYSTAAIDATNALNQLSAENVDAATADMESCSSAMSRGNTKIAAATSAVQRYSANQGD